MTTGVSVVIPAYGRVGPLKYTLRSAAESIVKSGYLGEIIVVDDGSEPSIEEQLSGFDVGYPVRFVRQANQGSIVASLTGFREAKGHHVQFLNSDELVHPDGLREQVRVVAGSGADVSVEGARALRTLRLQSWLREPRLGEPQARPTIDLRQIGAPLRPTR
jgi:glycosyltransferase involved in cell wall biosynthesis